MTHPLNESSDELQISRKKLNTRNYVIADLRFRFGNDWSTDSRYTFRFEDIIWRALNFSRKWGSCHESQFTEMTKE